MSFTKDDDDVDDGGRPMKGLVDLEKKIIKIQEEIDEHRQRDTEYGQWSIPDLVEELEEMTNEHKMRVRTMKDQETRAGRQSWRRFLSHLSLTSSA